MYILTIKTWNGLIATIILEAFANFWGKRVDFMRKRMYSLVNVENFRTQNIQRIVFDFKCL